MITKDVKRLLLKLNDPMTRALEGAAGLAVGRGHYEVTVEHLLMKLLRTGPATRRSRCRASASSRAGSARR